MVKMDTREAGGLWKIRQSFPNFKFTTPVRYDTLKQSADKIAIYHFKSSVP